MFREYKARMEMVQDFAPWSASVWGTLSHQVLHPES